MAVSNQDRVRFRRQMSHPFSNARVVRLNTRTECDAQKIHPREIRIDKQGVVLDFELVAVCAEVSHAHSVARRRARVVNSQVSIGIQPRAKSLRGESEEKKKRAFQSFTIDSIELLHCGQLQVCLTNSARLVTFND